MVKNSKTCVEHIAKKITSREVVCQTLRGVAKKLLQDFVNEHDYFFC
jgi:hypothetical protein